MSVLGGVGKTLSSVADKAGKASKLKSVKLKLKFAPQPPPPAKANGQE
jgi:hypothetical protein